MITKNTIYRYYFGRRREQRVRGKPRQSEDNIRQSEDNMCLAVRGRHRQPEDNTAVRG
jgi:hypothetical protein